MVANKIDVTAALWRSLQNSMFLEENLILNNGKKWAFKKQYLVLHEKAVSLPVLWKLARMSHPGAQFHIQLTPASSEVIKIFVL